MDSIGREAERRATEAVPTIPCDTQGPVFHEPWEAQAFALALTLHDKGLFAWKEWAAMLGEEIKKAQAAGDPDTGTTYYRHWMATLERMVAEKGVTTADTLTRYCHAWDRAAHRTPHGRPIELRQGDFEVSPLDQGFQAGRLAHRTADEVRVGNQPQDRKGARHHDPALAARPRR